MSRKYNGLTSVKVDLEAIGVCLTCGNRFTDPQCTHGTPEQIEAAKRLDEQAENEYAIKQVYRNRRISYGASVGTTAEEMDQAAICVALVADVSPRLEVLLTALEAIDELIMTQPFTSVTPSPEEMAKREDQGCGNDDLYNYARGG